MLILASIVAITVYRLAAFFAFSARLRAQDLKELEPLKEYVTPQIATSVTASLISFVVIMVLNILYERVAIWITNFGEFCTDFGVRSASSGVIKPWLSTVLWQSSLGQRPTTRTA